MSTDQHRTARRLRAAVVVLGIAVLGQATAEPILHEYIELGPGQGMVEPAVTGERPNHAKRAPGDAAAGPEPAATDQAAGTTDSGSAVGSAFSIDADTTRPERVDYSDPFTPTVVPFKRSIAYDTINRDGDLIVRDARLTPVEMRQKAGVSDEHFRASLELDLEPRERISIPSVAPGARLVVAHAEPPRAFRISVDSAENWFVESNAPGRVQLTLQLVVDRRVFGSAFRDASWSELGRELPPLPENVKSSALEVARTLGVASALRPRQAIASLVDHFRRFSPSTKRPSSRGLLLYRDLALTARGICRHRSYAFMITALGLGIPTRYVMNEAHAWVEVFDGELWHRIDLGGAAEQLSMDEHGRPRHVEPRDPFEWPDASESGNALATRSQPAGADGATNGSANGSTAPSDTESSDRDPAAPADPAGAEPAAGDPDPSEDPAEASPDGPSPQPSAPSPPATPFDEPANMPEGSGREQDGPDRLSQQDVRLDQTVQKAERGKTLFVSGAVRGGDRACQGASVDVVLVTESGNVPLGALVSNAKGEFNGRLVIPWNAPLGSHRLEATATGKCGAD